MVVASLTTGWTTSQLHISFDSSCAPFDMPRRLDISLFHSLSTVCLDVMDGIRTME